MADTSIYTDPTNMDKANVQLSIWNGQKWVELSNGLTINTINANVSAIADKVAEAQQGIAQATTDAQNAVDKANTAITQSGLANDTATTAKQTADTAINDAKDAQAKAQTASDNVATVSSDLDTTKANLQTVSAQATQNGKDIATTNSTVSGLKTDLANTQGDVTELKTTASGLETDITNAQGDISQLKQSATTMQSDIKDNSDNISTVTQTATGLTADMKDAQGDISTLKTNVSGLISTVSTVENTANTNKTNISSLSSTVSGLNSTVSSLSSDNSTNKTNISSLQNTASGLTTSVTALQSDNTTNKSNISSLQQTASGITSNVSSLQTQVNNSANGANLLTGTGSNAVLTGTNISNQTMYNYLLDNGYTASKLATAYGTQFTVSFDWSVSGSSPSGSFSVQWNAVPWGISSVATVSSSNTSGHFTKTFSVGTTTANVATMIGFRFDNFVGTMTISHVKLERGSVATPWCLAPSDVATVTSVSQVKQEADSISSTVTTNKTSSDSQFSTINQNISSIQSTVSNKADSSTVTQLSSDINLRVKSADLLSQINIESGNVLIQSNKIYLDASSVVFGGTAFITSAMISNISADDITTGTMTAGSINLGNGTFKVDSSGNLTANNANLTGTLSSGSSSSYNYEVSSDGIVFRDGTSTFATLEGFALNSFNYAGLASDNTVIGRTTKSDVVTGKVAYVSSSTSDGIYLNRVNAFNDNATSSLQLGNNLGSGMDYLNALLYDSTSKSGSQIVMYGYDSQNKKDTQAVYIKASNSSNSVSEISVDPTEVMLQSPNSTFTLDNSISKAVTLTTSEANGIQLSTSVGYISLTSATEIDLTAQNNVVLKSNSGDIQFSGGNLTMLNGGIVNTVGGVHIQNTRVDNELWVNGKLEANSLTVSGSKNAIVQTSKGWAKINAYETAEYYFGDLGKTNTGSGSRVKVVMDSLFLETVNTKIDYYVFVSSYGNGYAWVSDMDETSFIINSNVPNLEISYEVKAKRVGYEGDRLEIDPDYTEVHENVGVD